MNMLYFNELPEGKENRRVILYEKHCVRCFMNPHFFFKFALHDVEDLLY